MAADESYIQVAPDGSGKKVRNLQLDVLQPDGTMATVQMQVVSIVDEHGQLFAVSNSFPVEDNEIREALAHIEDVLEQILFHIVG
jgi:hypothetical protein